jgi:hypothetical protein
VVLNLAIPGVSDIGKLTAETVKTLKLVFSQITLFKYSLPAPHKINCVSMAKTSRLM